MRDVGRPGGRVARLLLRRRLPVLWQPATRWDDDGDDGSAGVREPRRPLPFAGGAAAMAVPEGE